MMRPDEQPVSLFQIKEFLNGKDALERPDENLFNSNTNIILSVY